MVGVELYWLPLGAAGHVVRWSGRVYEAMSALRERRASCALFHSALVVRLPTDFFVIEMIPVWQMSGEGRGVVAEGAVGTRCAGRLRHCRYEIHCWRGGTIPDVAEAVASPRRLSSDEATGRRLLAALPAVPTPVWGRDELRTGEMWNSNSLTSWAVVRSGLDVRTIRPPPGGRAPGWTAGVVEARRPVRDGGSAPARRSAGAA